jgi:hypothetical protein
VAEHHILIGDRDDIAVKRAGVDRRGILTQEDRPIGPQSVPACDGGAGFKRLPRDESRRARRRRIERFLTINEQLISNVGIRGRQTQVIRRSFVAENC